MATADMQPRRPAPPVPISVTGSLQRQQSGLESSTPSWRALAAEGDDDDELELSALRKHVPLPTDWTPPARHGGRGASQGAAGVAGSAAASVAQPSSADQVDAEAPHPRASMTVQPRLSASSAAGAVVRVRVSRTSSSDKLSQQAELVAPPPAAAQPLPDAGRVSETVLPVVASGDTAVVGPVEQAQSGRRSDAPAVALPPPAPEAAAAATAAGPRLSTAPRNSSGGEPAAAAAGAAPDGVLAASTAALRRSAQHEAGTGLSHARLVAALKRGSHAVGEQAVRPVRLSHSGVPPAAEPHTAAAAAPDAAVLAAQAAQHASIAALRQSRQLARKARVSRSMVGVDGSEHGEESIAAPSPRDAPPSPSPAPSPRTALPPIPLAVATTGDSGRRISGTAVVRPPGSLVTRSMDDLRAQVEQQRAPRASVPAAPSVSSLGTRPRLDPGRPVALAEPAQQAPPAPQAPPRKSSSTPASQLAPAAAAGEAPNGSKAGEEGPVWSPTVPHASVATRQKLSALRKSLHSHHPSLGGPSTPTTAKAAGDAGDGRDAPAMSPLKPAAAPPPPSPPPAPATAPPRVLSEAALSQAATEVEMVFRLGSLATDGDVSDAVAAATRLRHLLATVATVAKAIGAEPQNVFAYLVTHMHCLTAASLRSSLERQAAVPAANGRTRMSVTHTGPPPVWPDADAVLGGQGGAQELCAGVAELRRLVRIKVQDNNDLALANRCVNDACSFFDSLAAFAQAQGLSPSQAMAHLRAMP